MTESTYISRGCQATGRAARWHAPPVDNHTAGGPALAGHPSQPGGSDIEMLADKYWNEHGQDEAPPAARGETA